MENEPVNINPKAVILTAIPFEYKAVKAHLIDPKEETHQKGNV